MADDIFVECWRWLSKLASVSKLSQCLQALQLLCYSTNLFLIKSNKLWRNDPWTVLWSPQSKNPILKTLKRKKGFVNANCPSGNETKSLWISSQASKEMLAIAVMKQVVEGKPDFLVTLWLAAPNDKWGEVSGKIAQEWAMLDARAKLGGNGLRLPGKAVTTVWDRGRREVKCTQAACQCSHLPLPSKVKLLSFRLKTQIRTKTN